jgi:hypothetical protein
VYPLCVDKEVEIALKMLRDSAFKPDREYTLPSTMVTAANAAQLYQELTAP